MGPLGMVGTILLVLVAGMLGHAYWETRRGRGAERERAPTDAGHSHIVIREHASGTRLEITIAPESIEILDDTEGEGGDMARAARSYIPVRTMLLGPQGRSSPIFLLTADVETSGPPHDPHAERVCLAGCLMDAQDLTDFEREWEAVLQEFHVSEMQMKDWAQSTGLFTAWKGNDSKRRAFLGRLLPIMDGYVRVYIGGPKHRAQTGDRDQTYEQCLRFVLTAACWEARNVSAEATLHIIMEKPPDGMGTAVQMVVNLQKEGGMFRHLGPISLATKREALPLQAAEIAAYELNTPRGSQEHSRWTDEQINRRRIILLSR